jgi:hypothetical protein
MITLPIWFTVLIVIYMIANIFLSFTFKTWLRNLAASKYKGIFTKFDFEGNIKGLKFIGHLNDDKELDIDIVKDGASNSL